MIVTNDGSILGLTVTLNDFFVLIIFTIFVFIIRWVVYKHLIKYYIYWKKDKLEWKQYYSWANKYGHGCYHSHFVYFKRRIHLTVLPSSFDVSYTSGRDKKYGSKLYDYLECKDIPIEISVDYGVSDEEIKNISSKISRKRKLKKIINGDQKIYNSFEWVRV